MSYIRHDRPLLRYLDNIRRESKSYFPTSIAKNAKRNSKSVILKNQNNNTSRDQYILHIHLFDSLAESSKTIIEKMIDNFNVVVVTRVEYIKSISSSKNRKNSKLLYDNAQSSLRDCCLEYNSICRDELKYGSSPTKEWFSKLRLVLGSDWLAFEELDQIIRETSVDSEDRDSGG